MQAYLEDFEEFELDEFEDNLEDPFFGSLLRKVPWRRLAATAGRSVLKSGLSGVLGGLLGEADDEAFAGNSLGSYESFEDLNETSEAEAEAEYESAELFEMEALAESALAAESDAEADAFIGALISAATKILPKALSIGKRVLPSLIRGSRGLTHTLRRNPATRQLIRTIPTIARNTAVQLLRDHTQGHPVNGRKALRVLAGQASRVLSKPATVRRCVHRSRQRARGMGAVGRRHTAARRVEMI